MPYFLNFQASHISKLIYLTEGYLHRNFKSKGWQQCHLRVSGISLPGPCLGQVIGISNFCWRTIQGYKQLFHGTERLSKVNIPTSEKDPEQRPTEEKTPSFLSLESLKTPELFAGTLLWQHFRERMEVDDFSEKWRTPAGISGLKNTASLTLQMNGKVLQHFKRSSIGFSGLFAWCISKRAAYLGRSTCCQTRSEEVSGFSHRRCAAWQRGWGVGRCTALPTLAHNPSRRSARAASAEGRNREHHCSQTQRKWAFKTPSASPRVTLPTQTGKIKPKIWTALFTIRVPRLSTKDVLFAQANPKDPCQAQGLVAHQLSDLSLVCTCGEFLGAFLILSRRTTVFAFS